LAAKVLAEIYHLPLIGINHIIAHGYVNFLNPNPPKFPMLALIVSGGHTQLMLFNQNLRFELLGATRDDAAGEAFDKVAKLIGLGYPGGPAISLAAREGNDQAYSFPVAKLGKDSLDFSFSGLKTAVLLEVLAIAKVNPKNTKLKKTYFLPKKIVNDLSASFQKAVVCALVEKTVLAYQKYTPASVVVGGGVAANQLLRQELSKKIPTVQFVEPHLCTDNAVMIGTLAYFMYQQGLVTSPQDLEVDSSLEKL